MAHGQATEFQFLGPALAAFGIGIALGAAPGPIQAVLLSEAVRGGPARGIRALLGANAAFAVPLLALALGLSLAAPSEPALRFLKGCGGAFLLWLAVDGWRATSTAGGTRAAGPAMPPSARGAIAVALNPGVWLFLATVATSLLSAAYRAGGIGAAILVAAILLVSSAIVDFAVVFVGGLAVRRASRRIATFVHRASASLLALLGVWLLLSAAAL